MATTGTNYTAKWKLVDGVLTISPVSGNSGEMRGAWVPSMGNNPYIKEVVDMTDEEWLSVTHIVFVGSIKIKMQEFGGSGYYSTAADLFAQTSPYLSYGDFSLSNVVSIDVSGLDTAGCTGFVYTFQYLTSLVEIIGLDTLDTSSANNYSFMFNGTSLSELDLSSFSNMNTANIQNMFSGMNYLESVILPNNFSRTSSALNNEETTYKSIGMASSQIHATNSQTHVTISSDNDFFALLTGQGGVWTRDISGSATLSFKIRNVVRDGNNVNVSYSYTTSTATAYVYLKESSASSYPQNPTTSIPLRGTGNDSFTLTLSTDGSYEIQIIVTDGNTNLYVFTPIDSNVLLIEIDNNGNVRAAGDIEDGYGNKLSEMIDLFYPVGSYYETSKSQAEFDPNDVWGGTWVLEASGNVHVSSGTGYTLGATGGSPYIQEHTHGFTQPVYTVTGGAVTDGITGGSHHHATSRKANAGSGTARYIPDADSTSNNVSTTDTTHKHNLPSHSHTVTRTTNGAVNAVSGLPSGQTTGDAGNMPPYIVVNRWHRTA